MAKKKKQAKTKGERMIKLYNQDCFRLVPSMDDNSIDMVLTDPCYDLSKEQMLVLSKEFFRICKGAIYIFCRPGNQWVPEPDQYLFWAKPISTKNTSKRYSRFVEMIFLYQGEKQWNTASHWSNYVNIFIDRVDSIAEHEFRKPPSLITRLILNHSDENDIIFDPFFGSAVVAEVAKLHNRNFIGCEIKKHLYILDFPDRIAQFRYNVL